MSEQRNYKSVDDVKSGEKLYLLDGDKYKPGLVIGWHPEVPMVVFECDESIGCVMMQDLYRKV